MLNLLSLLFLFNTADAFPINKASQSTDLMELCDEPVRSNQLVSFYDEEGGMVGLQVEGRVTFGVLELTYPSQISNVFGNVLAAEGSFDPPTKRQIRRTERKAIKMFGSPDIHEDGQMVWIEDRAVWINFKERVMMAECQ